MLELKNISKTFNAGTVNQKVALNGLNLTMNEGDFVTVIGGNGAGKSTMLNAIAGVFQVDTGKILIDGVDVTALPEYKRAKYIGRVFQDPMMGTAATMQIEENLALAARRGKPRTLRPGITKADREFYKEQLRILDLGLEDRMTTKVGLLSGGQRQALTLLMATLQQPKLLLLDEHTAALAGGDPADRREEPPDHHDDHPQYARRHFLWQPPDHDVRGACCGGRFRRGKEESDGGAAAESVQQSLRLRRSRRQALTFLI